MSLEHLHLTANDDDHEEHRLNADKDDIHDEEEGEVSEKSHLLADAEDEETARQLQNFMESVTTKILERNHNGLETLPADSGTSPEAEDRDIRVAMGTESYGSTSQTERASSPSSKQPLLQEMSEPSQDIGSGDKSVEC